jgi:hypothetical protein
LSSEISYLAGAETVGHVEGNMCGLAMREAVVPPESLEHITCKRRPSEAGRSPDWPIGGSRSVRIGKARSRSR